MRQKRRSGSWLPSIASTHPMFFIMLMIVAFHHLWMATTQAFAFSRFVKQGVPHNVQSLAEVYRYVPRGVWIGEAAVVFACLMVGAYTNWRWVQLGLGIGLFFTVMRVWLIEAGPAPGAGLGVWIVVVGIHFVQLLEPPSNPATANRNPFTGHSHAP